MSEKNTYKRIIIINPRAGRQKRTSALISELLHLLEKKNLFIPVKFSEYAGHASVLAQEAIEKGYDHFIVVGGDGTINDVASVLIKYPEKTLALVATGSGNGLANYFQLPCSPEAALEVALQPHTVSIDVGWVNEIPFFSVAGIGFDALIARRFAQSKGRGFFNYLINVVKTYPFYKPKTYSITIENKTFITKALLITFSNSNQYGNQISLAPQASPSDGVLHMIVMKKIPLWLALLLWPLLFLKILHKTPFVKIYPIHEATIQFHHRDYLHIDGDPYPLKQKKLHIRVQPASLKIHIPSYESKDI
jgi:YegS/Rv2252/BmrU family lipid kinase